MKKLVYEIRKETNKNIQSQNIHNIKSHNLEFDKIAVLIPCLNEEKTIKCVVEGFKKELPYAQIYVYDNNSDDNTAEIAKQTGVITIKEENRGKANVVMRMFREIDADIYIVVDGDGTYPADAVKYMINIIKHCNAGMVVGDRISNNSYKKSNKRVLHYSGNHIITSIINRFFHSNLKDILSGYRVFSKEFVKNFSSFYSGFELETDFTLFALNYKIKIVEIPIQYKERPIGSKSKLNTFSDGFRIISAFLNLYRFYKPFSFFAIISITLFFVSIFLGYFPILEYIRYGYILKFPTAILATGIMITSILLFCCGLILDTIIKIDRKNMMRIILKK